VGGAALVIAGALLLVSVGLYRSYAIYARSQLDELNFSIEELSPPSLFQSGEAAYSGTFLPTDATLSRVLHPSDVGGSSGGDPRQSGVPPLSVSRYASMYPGTQYPGAQIHPKYWDAPLWAGADPYTYRDFGLPEGFRPVSASDFVAPVGMEATAQQIRIPIIGVDSPVSELAILDLGNSREYETPKNVVGHIPKTANPGESGSGWFFGHLESPIRGEGDVFRKLPKIPEYLKNGDPVYVILSREDGEYLYQVTSTQVVYQDDLVLHDSEDATITLVVCVPRLVYDHRLLATAKLVGVNF
jgi:LPXTG-site transpeptidase (sortase) family protein